MLQTSYFLNIITMFVKLQYHYSRRNIRNGLHIIHMAVIKCTFLAERFCWLLFRFTSLAFFVMQHFIRYSLLLPLQHSVRLKSRLYYNDHCSNKVSLNSICSLVVRNQIMNRNRRIMECFIVSFI